MTLADHFEHHRPRLRAVAYRMLGTLAEADDAVQDAWLRLSRSEADEIENLGGWLTTVVARECLHVLRSRRRRHEEPERAAAPDPEQEALLADSVGLALLVVLDRLTPAERLAFVLHDMFELPFEEIAGILGRTPAATRQLASRARRRVSGAEVPETDLTRQRRVVDAFYAAARGGDFDALVQVLHPEVVLRTDFGPDGKPAVIRGAAAVARQARAAEGGQLRPVVVDGAVGSLVTRDGRPFAMLVFTVADDRIVGIEGIGEPDRLQRLVSTVTSLPPEGSEE